MFKLMGTVLKTVIFGFVALVVGQLASFQGRTLSDHVKVIVSQLQRTSTADMVRKSVDTWSDTMSMSHSQARPAKGDPAPKEALSSDERRELRRLLQNK